MSLCWVWDLWRGFSVFPNCFDMGIFWATPHMGVTQFLNFFQRELFHVQLCIWCMCRRREIQEPPLSPSCSRIVNKCFLTKWTILGTGIEIWTGRYNLLQFIGKTHQSSICPFKKGVSIGDKYPTAEEDQKLIHFCGIFLFNFQITWVRTVEMV